MNPTYDQDQSREIEEKERDRLARRGAALDEAHAAATQQRWREAAKAYATALELGPDTPALRVQLGHMLKESGDFAGAHREYSHALRSMPWDADLLLQFGHLYKLMGDLESSYVAYRASATLNNNTHALRELDSFSDIRRSIIESLRAVATAPETEARESEDALPATLAWSSIVPDDSIALGRLATLLTRARHYREAILARHITAIHDLWTPKSLMALSRSRLPVGRNVFSLLRYARLAQRRGGHEQISDLNDLLEEEERQASELSPTARPEPLRADPIRAEWDNQVTQSHVWEVLGRPPGELPTIVEAGPTSFELALAHASLYRTTGDYSHMANALKPHEASIRALDPGNPDHQVQLLDLADLLLFALLEANHVLGVVSTCQPLIEALVKLTAITIPRSGEDADANRLPLQQWFRAQLRYLARSARIIAAAESAGIRIGSIHDLSVPGRRLESVANEIHEARVRLRDSINVELTAARSTNQDNKVAVSLAQLASLWPEESGIQKDLGHLYRRRRLMDQSARAFEAAQQINPYDVDTIVQLAHSFKEMGRWAEAEKYYRTALEAAPDNPNTQIDLTLFIKSRGDWGQTVAELLEVSRQSPDNDFILRETVNAALKVGDRPAAKVALNRLVIEFGQVDMLRRYAYATLFMENDLDALLATSSAQFAERVRNVLRETVTLKNRATRLLRAPSYIQPRLLPDSRAQMPFALLGSSGNDTEIEIHNLGKARLDTPVGRPAHGAKGVFTIRGDVWSSTVIDKVTVCVDGIQVTEAWTTKRSGREILTQRDIERPASVRYMAWLNTLLIPNGVHELQIFVQLRDSRYFTTERLILVENDRTPADIALELSEAGDGVLRQQAELYRNSDRRLLVAVVDKPGAPDIGQFQRTLKSIASQSVSAAKVFVLGAERSELDPGEAGEGLDIEFVASGDLNAWLGSVADTPGGALVFVGFGDELRPDALANLVDTAEDYDADAAYGDEVALTEAGAKVLLRKPAWSPDMIVDSPYVGRPLLIHAAAVRRLLSDAAGAGERIGDEHALLIRASKAGLKVAHRPTLLSVRRHAPRAAPKQEPVPAAPAAAPVAAPSPISLFGGGRGRNARAAQPPEAPPPSQAAEDPRTSLRPSWRLTRGASVSLFCTEASLPQVEAEIARTRMPRGGAIELFVLATDLELSTGVSHRLGGGVKVAHCPTPGVDSPDLYDVLLRQRSELLVVVRDAGEIRGAPWLGPMLAAAMRENAGLVGLARRLPGFGFRPDHFVAAPTYGEDGKRGQDVPVFGAQLDGPGHLQNVLHVYPEIWATAREPLREAYGRVAEPADKVALFAEVTAAMASLGRRNTTLTAASLTPVSVTAGAPTTIAGGGPRDPYWDGPYIDLDMAISSEEVAEAYPMVLDAPTTPFLDRTKVKRILLVRVDQLGDLMVSVAGIARIRELFPDARITLMVGPWNEALARALPGMDEVITARLVLNPQHTRRLLDEEGQVALKAKLAGYNFDVAIDLSPGEDSRPLLRLSGAPFTVGFHPDEYPWLSLGVVFKTGGDSLAIHGQRIHQSRLVQSIASAMEVVIDPSPPRLYATEEMKKAAQGALERLEVPRDGRKLVVIHVGARTVSRVWPPERYVEVARVLVAKANARVLFMGGPTEAPMTPMLEKLTAGSAPGDLILAINALSQAEFLGLLTTAQLVLGNDSGPKHVAATFGVATLSVHMGAVPNREWGPSGERALSVIKKAPCSPCGIEDPVDCGNGLVCLLGVTAEGVAHAALRLLANTDAPAADPPADIENPIGSQEQVEG